MTVESHYRGEFCFLFFVFWEGRPNLRGGNSYHSSFDDPLGKGAALKADVTLQKCQIKAGNQECFEKLHLHYFQSLIHPLFWNSAASSPFHYVTVDRAGSQLKIKWGIQLYIVLNQSARLAIPHVHVTSYGAAAAILVMVRRTSLSTQYVVVR